MPLDVEELEHVLDEVRQLICVANRDGTLEDVLNKLGLQYLVKGDDCYRTEETSLVRIIVLGESSVEIRHLQGIAKACGVSKERIVFYDYDEAQRYDLGNWKYNSSIAAILCGPLPHKGTGMGDASSIIVALEGEAGYPPTFRMGISQGLKLTKTSFSNTLNDLISKKIILPDIER